MHIPNEELPSYYILQRIVVDGLVEKFKNERSFSDELKQDLLNILDTIKRKLLYCHERGLYQRKFAHILSGRIKTSDMTSARGLVIDFFKQSDFASYTCSVHIEEFPEGSDFNIQPTTRYEVTKRYDLFYEIVEQPSGTTITIQKWI